MVEEKWLYGTVKVTLILLAQESTSTDIHLYNAIFLLLFTVKSPLFEVLGTSTLISNFY